MRPPPRRDKQERGAFTRRLLVLGAVQAAAFAGLGAHLYGLQVLNGRRYGTLAASNRVASHLLTPVRGSIVDRHGEPLVVGEEAYRAFLIPTLAPDIEQVVRLAARILPGISDSDIERILARARRQRPSEPILLGADLDFEMIGRLGLLAPQLPGIEIERAERRRYVAGATAGHVVGHVGNVEAVALDEDPVRMLPWTRTGRAGLERGQEARLAGRSGRVAHEVDARGRIVGRVARVEPQPGEAVVAAIDTGFQAEVERQLSEHRCAAAVVLDIGSGDVLAMASQPGYDPGSVAHGLQPDAWRRLASAPDDPLLNRATTGAYPPGSTFKMVTALAALEAHVIAPGQAIACRGAYHYGGHLYRCWNRSGHGSVDLVAALRCSCDVFFYEMARRTGIERIAALARRLGLGVTYPLGIDEQSAGVVPTRDWKRGRSGRSWLGGETVLAGIGQGYVLTTPLQLAVMTARIASGRAVLPRLVIDDAAGSAAAAPPPPLAIAPDHLALVRRGMLEAVNAAGGTAARARLDRPGVQLAGKTGTAQVRRGSGRSDDAPWELRDHALFVAYAPAGRPRYAASVVVEHGGSGGSVAAPLARAIIEEALRADPAVRLPVAPTSAADADRPARPKRQQTHPGGSG